MLWFAGGTELITFVWSQTIYYIMYSQLYFTIKGSLIDSKSLSERCEHDQDDGQFRRLRTVITANIKKFEYTSYVYKMDSGSQDACA